MKNNSSKSEILVISTKKTDKILNEVLENGVKKIVKSKNWIKVLGVYIDHMLSWSKQIGMVKKRATNIIRKIHRINKFLPLKLKLTLYNTLIVPIFNYADFQILTFKLVSAASFIYYFIYYWSFPSLFITALPGLNIAIIDFFAQTHFL